MISFCSLVEVDNFANYMKVLSTLCFRSAASRKVNMSDIALLMIAAHPDNVWRVIPVLLMNIPFSGVETCSEIFCFKVFLRRCHGG